MSGRNEVKFNATITIDPETGKILDATPQDGLSYGDQRNAVAWIDKMRTRLREMEEELTAGRMFIAIHGGDVLIPEEARESQDNLNQQVVDFIEEGQ